MIYDRELNDAMVTGTKNGIVKPSLSIGQGCLCPLHTQCRNNPVNSCLNLVRRGILIIVCSIVGLFFSSTCSWVTTFRPCTLRPSSGILVLFVGMSIGLDTSDLFFVYPVRRGNLMQNTWRWPECAQSERCQSWTRKIVRLYNIQWYMLWFNILASIQFWFCYWWFILYRARNIGHEIF